MHLERRVVITGLGALSPLGNSAKTSWGSCLEGVSGIQTVDFGIPDCPVSIAGKLKNFDVNNYLSVKESRRIDPFVQYGLIAANQAIEDSGLGNDDYTPERAGVSLGSGIGGLHSIEKNHHTLNDSGIRKVSPFFVPGSIVNMISGLVSIEHQFKGPNHSVVTACSSGSHCIGIAARSVAYGEADIMIAGGAEMASTPLGIAGFVSSRALSTNNNPAEASRPWDENRDGFVLSDGAGALVLEELEHAKSRNANIYAELVGFGMSSDAYHMTAPPESGVGAALAMSNALNDSKLDPDEVDYINAHGTSTPLGDIAETKAIKKVFSNPPVISSTKSMTGHTLGAAGALESIFSILALQDQIIPPTINLHNQDPECDLDYNANEARDKEVNVVMNNSFGFGGTNSTLVFKKI
ncbi:beta-ketoacyl-ACP synthase II [Gammaproteobacteria bacterium]|nr:beta-ketoacyl-ACP synthase II [Gammaproteobacteria bacterium]